MIRLVDGNAYFRRIVEAAGSGSALRNLLIEVQNNPLPQIWVWDGAYNLRRRRALYPRYKAQRSAPPEDVAAARTLFQEVLLHTQAVQVRVPEYEADDVIAAFVAHYATVESFLIESHDKDLLALTSLPNVQITRDQVPGVHPSEMRLWKTLCGDQSDNIKGLKGFGPKSWLACDRDAFMNLFAGVIELQSIPDLESHFGITKICATWLRANEQELRAMWTVIGFLDVPWDLVTANSIAGKPDASAADRVLGEFLL